MSLRFEFQLAVVFAALFSPFGNIAHAEPADSTRSTDAPASFELFPPRVRAGSFIYLPKLYYSSETSLGVGGDVLLPFTIDGLEASVRLQGRVTFKGQGQARLVTTIGSGERGLGIKTSLRYSTIPLRFYGIGPDTPDDAEEIYQPRAIDGYVEVFRRILTHVEVGVRIEFDHHEFISVEDDGALATGTIRGTEGGVVAGGGLIAELDTRDRKYSPTSGWYMQAFATAFDDELASEHDFNNYHADLRRYDRVGSGVLATQLFWFSVRGRPPFWRYAALGGRAHTRGYRKARYIDRDLLAGQVEVRHQLWRRVEGAAFAGLAGVAPRLTELRLAAARVTTGLGLRFRVREPDDIRAALDVAFGGPLSRTRVYLSLGEAF